MTYKEIDSQRIIPQDQDSLTFVINASDYWKWFLLKTTFYTEEVRGDPDNVLTSGLIFSAPAGFEGKSIVQEFHADNWVRILCFWLSECPN